MQFSNFILLATSAFAIASPINDCTAEYKKCQQSKSTLAFMSTCTLNFAACSALGGLTIADESLNETMSKNQKKEYRKCKEEYDACRVAPGANISTCSSEVVACFAEVREE